MIYSVHLDYDQMNLIYKCLQRCQVDGKEIKKIRAAMMMAQLSYGVKSVFHE